MPTDACCRPPSQLDVDRERTRQLGVPLDRVHETLQAYLGSLYVNDFTLLGRCRRSPHRGFASSSSLWSRASRGPASHHDSHGGSLLCSLWTIPTLMQSCQERAGICHAFECLCVPPREATKL